MRIMCVATAATLVLSSVLGCSNTTAGKPSKGSPAPTSSAVSSAPPTAGSSSTIALPTQQQLEAALLKASDLGSDFTDGAYTKTNNPLPCAGAGTPSFRKQTAPALDGGASLESAALQAALGEQIFIYADAAAAQQALTVAKNGLNCANGMSYSTDGTSRPIAISPATDVGSDLSVDAGFTWQLHNTTIQGTAAAIEIGPVILTLSFAAAAGADTSKLPDVLAVAKTAIAKLKSS